MVSSNKKKVPKKLKQNKKPAVVLLVAALVLLTAAVGLGANYAINGEFLAFSLPPVFPPKNEDASSVSILPEAPVIPNLPPETVTAEPVSVRMPDELRAVTLVPGQDYFPARESDVWKKQIDEAIELAASMSMNAIVLETVGREDYAGIDVLDEIGYEAIGYAAQKTREKDMYSLAVLHVTDNNIGVEQPVPGNPADALVVDLLTNMSIGLAQSKPDGIMIDGYYHVTDQNSFSSYLNTGAATGYDNYLSGVPKGLIRHAYDTIKKQSPSVLVGLVTEPVWANHDEDERGSYTDADFSVLYDGNVDTKALMEQGQCDFVAVKAFGSLDDPETPYHSVTSWWSEVSLKTGVPLFIIHASDRAVSDAVGWGEYDQLARQVIVARELTGYSGSVFNCLTRLVENPKDCAGKLQGYYEGTVSAEHILTDLEVTQPVRTVFTSLNPSVLFAGNSDPNTEATINNVPIVTDENGYFSLEMSLKEGENTFIIAHKGKTATYKISRVVEVVREVTPTGKLTVDGGTKLTITAVAYEKAKVYAVVNGQSIAMALSEDKENDDLRDTAYRRFVGTYTIPEPTTSVQNLGSVVVYGEWDVYKKSKTGAAISVNPRALPSDGRPIMVISDRAETFPGNTISHYSDPSFFPLPKGALDYAIGSEIRYSVIDENNKQKTYSFYRLQSGLRVLTEDIGVIGASRAPVDNIVSACTVTSDNRHTSISLRTSQQVSYTARYTPDAISIQFHYTKALPQSMSLNRNPLFSSVEFSGDTMVLTLKNRGVFLGVTPYYDNAGNLVFRFNNPPAVSGNSLNNVKIVIDPGHGGNDTGALGYLGAYPEKVVNYAIAGKLASILQSRGATVVMYDTRNTTISLEQRANMAAAADPLLFISVHSNSSAYNRAAVGSEAYYFNPFSYALSQLSAGNMANALNTVNRGGKFGYYYVTRTMQYPAILVETGFMSNQTEYSKLVNSAYQNNIATGLANSVASYLRLMGENAGLTGTQQSTLGAVPAQPVPAAPVETPVVSGEVVEVEVPPSPETTDSSSESSS